MSQRPFRATSYYWKPLAPANTSSQTTVSWRHTLSHVDSSLFGEPSAGYIVVQGVPEVDEILRPAPIREPGERTITPLCRPRAHHNFAHTEELARVEMLDRNSGSQVRREQVSPCTSRRGEPVARWPFPSESWARGFRHRPYSRSSTLIIYGRFDVEPLPQGKHLHPDPRDVAAERYCGVGNIGFARPRVEAIWQTTARPDTYAHSVDVKQP